jgi:hypothetical protein
MLYGAVYSGNYVLKFLCNPAFFIFRVEEDKSEVNRLTSFFSTNNCSVLLLSIPILN